MNKRLLLTALLLSSLSVSGGVYAAERLVVGPDESASIIGQTISGLTTPSKGGAVFTEGNLVIKDTTFDGNKIESDSADSGGAIFVDAINKTIDITNSTFTNNIALNTSSPAADGSAISVKNGTVNIIGSTFENNKADYGTIYQYASNSGTRISTINIDNSTFKNNEALSVGGVGIFNVGNVTNTTFEGNKATDDNGGAMYVGSEGKATLDKVTFKNNTSASSGGAIYTREAINADSSKNNNSGAVLKITNSTFEGNSAAKTGGAIDNHFYADGNGITNSTFKNNSAANGGAIYNHSDEDSQGKAADLKVTGGSFEGNSATDKGGAIFNESTATITDADFTNNSATNSGGAIYTQGPVTAALTTVTRAKFVGNNSDNWGGAAYVTNATFDVKDSIFENNTAAAGGALAGGTNASNLLIDNTEFRGNSAGWVGALGVFKNATITNSIFENNTATDSTKPGAGAMFVGSEGAVATLDKVTFKNNTSASSGGAIGTRVGENETGSHNNNSAAILNITNSTFEGNSAATTGGAIDNHFYNAANGIKDSTFKNNSAANGGAIYNHGDVDNQGKAADLKVTGGSFEGNSATGNGGAIFNESTATITDADFTNNSASGKGGAIYSEADITIKAESKNVTFSGNKSADGADIYMGKSGTNLNLHIGGGADDEYIMTFNGGISGDGGASGTEQFNVNITNDHFGEVVLNSYLKNANVTVHDTMLTLGENADISNQNNKIHFQNGGELYAINGKIDSFEGVDITIDDSYQHIRMGFSADVDLETGKGDNLGSALGNSQNGNIRIDDIAAIGNTTKNNVSFNLFDALGLNPSQATLATDVEAHDTLTPIRWLKGSVDETTGMVTYAPRGNSFGDFNPSVMAGPVAAQLGGFLTQINSYNQAFMNMDMKMLMTREERQAMRMRNSYAASSSPQVFSPTYLPEEQKAGWVRPYASFEKVGLDGGPRVNNVMYGSFFGADSDMYQLKNGAEAQFSVYAGYTGSHQTFSGNSIYQNGGTLGLTGIIYKDNFFTALTANTGASIADMSTAFGSEDMPMMMAGVASKSGYNWELAKGKFIIQPNYLMSYTFVNAFDYTNAAGVKIKSDAMNAIQIAPGVKFIGNLKNGWQPYINLRMVWNLMDKSEFTAANTSLPELSVKPYFEYGLGLQKRWGDRFTGFGQAMLRAGGRTGVGLGFGFRWALGKAPQKTYEPNYSQNIIQPTSVKLGNIK